MFQTPDVKAYIILSKQKEINSNCCTFSKIKHYNIWIIYKDDFYSKL